MLSKAPSPPTPDQTTGLTDVRRNVRESANSRSWTVVEWISIKRKQASKQPPVFVLGSGLHSTLTGHQGARFEAWVRGQPYVFVE